MEAHIEDSDREMAEMIRNQLKTFIDKRLDDTKDWMNERFNLFEV